jgi:hypothetical protein
MVQILLEKLRRSTKASECNCFTQNLPAGNSLPNPNPNCWRGSERGDDDERKKKSAWAGEEFSVQNLEQWLTDSKLKNERCLHTMTGTGVDFGFCQAQRTLG